MKTCSKCHTPKDPNQFRRNGNICNGCEKEYAENYEAKKQPSRAGVSQYNDMSYTIGMFLGEFKGFKKYM